MSRRHKSREGCEGGLFPSEAEIARRLGQSPAEWAAKAVILERQGLPHVDPIMGGRYWRSVLSFLDERYGLSSVRTFAPDGQENLDAL